MNQLDTQSKTKQTLERLYKFVIEQEQSLTFFKGFHSYFSFCFEEPRLKKAIDEQMVQRNDRYEKIKKAESEAVKEMRLAKDRILATIKKNKIDTTNFERPSTFPVWDTGGRNVVEELEAIENKKIEIHSSQSYSSQLQAYLFDISAGLKKIGYEKELGNLIVSSKEYGDYYQRIDGTSGYHFSGNERGNFIFSKTWPETFEQKNLLDRERALKPWGAFEKAIHFMRAYYAVMTNTSTWKIEQIDSPYDYLFLEEDLVEVFHMTEEFYSISGQDRQDSLRHILPLSANKYSNDKLTLVSFRHVLQTIHNIFIQTLEIEESEKSKKIMSGKLKKDICLENDILYFSKKKIPVERGQKSMIKLFLKNAEIYRGEKRVQKGAGVEIAELQKVGNYRDVGAFRDGLKRLRTKLKEAEFPATIGNPETGKYQIIIKYQ